MFYAVPEPVMAAVTRHLISDFAFVVYARLTGFWSAGRDVFVSNKDLALWLGKSTRQIVQALAELGEAGLIERKMKGRVRYIYPVGNGIGERQEHRRGKPRLRSAENRAPGARKTALQERGKPRSTNKERITNQELQSLSPTSPSCNDAETPAQPGEREKLENAKEMTIEERLAAESGKPVETALAALEVARKKGADFPYRYALSMLREGFEKVLTTEEEAPAKTENPVSHRLTDAQVADADRASAREKRLTAEARKDDPESAARWAMLMKINSDRALAREWAQKAENGLE